MAKLYFKYGAMGSSKTAQALITKYNYEENDMRVWLLKPSADTRDGVNILRSRVQAILKRIKPVEQSDRIEIDREHFQVRKGDQTIVLPRKEFALLELLHSQPGKLFTREEIYANVWGNKVVVGDRTIDVHIRKLRQKIGEEHIVTVKGVGYKYEESQKE